MPSAGNFTGDFSDSAELLTGSVNGPGFASTLNQRMNLATPSFWRALLLHWMREPEPVRFPECCDSDVRLVASGGEHA